MRMTARVVLAVCGWWLAATTVQATTLRLPGPDGAARQRARCRRVESAVSGNALVTTIPVNVGGRRYRMEVTTVAAPDTARSSTIVLTSGRRTWMRGEAVASMDGFTLHLELDAGARGVHVLELASTDGVTASGAVDG